MTTFARKMIILINIILFFNFLASCVDLGEEFSPGVFRAPLHSACLHSASDYRAGISMKPHKITKLRRNKEIQGWVFAYPHKPAGKVCLLQVT